MLDDIYDRTRNMHLRSNCLVKYYPIVISVISDFNLVGRFCSIWKYKVVTKLMKHELNCLDKKFIVAI